MPRYQVGEPLVGCRFFVDYIENTGRVQSVVCINNTPFDAHGQVTSPETGITFSRIFPPNTATTPETEQAIPPGAIRVRTRLDDETQQPILEGRDAGGNWVNLERQFRCPA